MQRLKAKHYPALKETLWYAKLANGLDVYLLKKAGFHKTYANMTADFGAVDRNRPDGKGQYPAGIAHFLEHKLFEKKDHDAFDLFGNLGADANAYTSFTKTSYLFSTTDKVKQCLNILLDFVQAPYFSQKSVAKEQGIIGSEITMYQDDADWRLYAATLAALFPNTPLAVDIAGTTSSISQITPELLYECYQTYYHPSNMSLFVVGNIDIEQTFAWIEQNQQQKNFAHPLAINHTKASELLLPAKKQTTLTLPVTNAKACVGIKATQEMKKSTAGMVQAAALELAFSLLFDENSQFYQELYDAGIIDDTFSYDVKLHRNFAMAMMAGDVANPREFCQKITARLRAAKEVLASQQAAFALEKKEFIGVSINALNSPETIAESFVGKHFGNLSALDMPQIYRDLTFEQMLKEADFFFSNCEISQIQLQPENKKG